jgi:hypothetical protein
MPLIDQLINGLVGAAFGLRAFDDRRPIWARAAYAAVGFDLVRAAYKGDPILTPGSVGDVQGRALRTATGDAAPALKFEEVKLRTNDVAERVKYIHKQMVAGTRDPQVYALARAVLSRKCGSEWCVKERDHRGEATALFNEVRSRVRYTLDPTDFDAFSSPSKTLAMHAGDCVPVNSLVMTSGHQLKPISAVQVGDVVMGDGVWTKVTNYWEKGEKRLLAFDLNNGCVLRCTPEHKLFVVPRQKIKGGPRSGKREEAVEVRARDVQVGDDLLTAKQIPFGCESLGVDRSWLMGVYIADGWDEQYRASISGKDGHPKEAQKKRVQEICERMGVATRWHERYIAINNPELSRWLGACGHGALQKHVPSMNLDEVSVAGVLEGCAADSSRTKTGTRVFGTISETLALQLRVMLRMQGKSCHIVRVDDHGGLGIHPIYRITERQNDRHRPHARVKGIRELPPERVVDIETDTHKFWLPESDVVVHNCDDQVILLGAMLRSVGKHVRSVVVQTKGYGTYNHIYAATQLPDSGQWMPLDPTVDRPAGWEVPGETVIAKKQFMVTEKGIPALR